MSEPTDSGNLRSELDRAYSQLAEVTSRLLAVNEASDLLVASHDQETLAVSLLEVATRSVGARTGAVFLAHGEGSFAFLASHGLSEDDANELSDSLPDLAIMNLVENEQQAFDVEEARASESFQDWMREQREADPEAHVEPAMELFAPLAIEGNLLAVLALGPPPTGRRYAADDRVFLEHTMAQGALALDRALLFAQNENRIRDLDALLRISRELTSTLDLDRVLVTAVNTTATIVERERAVLALYEGDRLAIRAVSDMPRVDRGTAEKIGVARLLEWLSLRRPDVLAVNASEVGEGAEIEGREVLADYFERDMRALLAIGLKDDQGPVGCLLLESFREGAFAEDSDRDALAVLAGQLAVSIRNAELYRQLPMVGALAPLAERRRKWQRLSPGERRRWMSLAALAVLVVAVIPWPHSIAGDARVLPAEEVPVRAMVPGIVKSIEVGPGERVRAGQLLARLDEEPGGARLAELRADAELARNRSAQAEAGGDPVERQMAQLTRVQALARAAAAQTAGDYTQLLAPVDGYVLTPALRGRIGSYLQAGDILCQVSPVDTLRVEAAVPETEVGAVRPGQRLRIKVLGFPDRQFTGRVTEVSWQGEAGKPGKPSNFLVRGWVANPGPGLRSGMTGRARVDVGVATFLSRWASGLYRAVRLGFWW
jgi:RND family efflux transporter MFP subunit